MRTAGCASGFGNLVNLNPIGFSLGRNKDNIVVGGRDKKLFYVIVFNEFCAVRALASLSLIFIRGNGNALYITQVRNKNDHIFFFDKVFYIDFFHFVRNDVRAPIVAEFFGKFKRFVFYKLKDFFRMRKKVFAFFDKKFQLFQFFFERFDFEACEALKLHVDNRLRLNVVKTEAFRKRFFCRLRIARRADDFYHFIDVIDGDDEGAQDVSALFGFAQIETDAPRYDFVAVFDKIGDQRL